jgi:hypothetical protein
MRKISLVVLSLLVFGSAVMAQNQNKVETKWHCAKQSADASFAVRDVPNHSYMILQGTCKATSSAGSFAEKTGAYTEFREVWKDSFTWHGRFNATMDNGDMVYYTYEGSKPNSNKWTIESGTGTRKGINGSGTCTGTTHEDGSSDWVCTGTFSMGKASSGK